MKLLKHGCGYDNNANNSINYSCNFLGCSMPFGFKFGGKLKFKTNNIGLSQLVVKGNTSIIIKANLFNG